MSKEPFVIERKGDTKKKKFFGKSYSNAAIEQAKFVLARKKSLANAGKAMYED